jgi:predicted small lipoprotein YifL
LKNSVSKPIFALVTIMTISACGVKGKPLPPVTASPIGSGVHPLATIEAQKKASQTKNKMKKDDDESEVESEK